MKQITLRGTLALLVFAFMLTPWAVCETQQPQNDPPKSRTFRFTYGATLKQLPGGARVRVWFPIPQSSQHQRIELLEMDLPTQGQTNMETTYGNKIGYFETAGQVSDRLSFSNAYLIQRREVRGLEGGASKVQLTAEQRKRFLSANAKVPLSGKPLTLLDGLNLSGDALTIARKLYDQVDDHVRYDKSAPGYGNGDVLWVCDSRFGNCTDFHSLFISLARAKGLPARFEIGFPLPTQRGEGQIGGYHCWASFYSDALGWVPVDISEADKHPEQKEYYFGNLTEDRVSLSTGRDIVLVPKQDGEPLNYFVYPYVEVDGEPWPNDKVELAVKYSDAEDKSSP